MSSDRLQFGLYTAGFAALIYGLQFAAKKKSSNGGSQDWGKSLDPSRDNPAGGDPIIPKLNPTDPTTSKDPLWMTTVDPFPTKPYCGINLSFRNPQPYPDTPLIKVGEPIVISWTPDMDQFTQETCLPIQDTGGWSGVGPPPAAPASVLAARKYTGFAPALDNLYSWDEHSPLAGTRLYNLAETIWYDPTTKMCTVPDAKGGYAKSQLCVFMEEPVGTPNEWKQNY